MTATTRYGANPAPSDLRIAQDLANTIGVGPEADLLDSPEAAQAWLETMPDAPRRPLREADLVRMRTLRAAIRAALGDADAGTTFGLSVRVDDRGISWQPPADPIDALQARVMYTLIEAQARGALSRLKLCQNARCRVAFFDESRNGSGRWHSAATCGNAARVRAHRDRLRGAG